VVKVGSASGNLKNPKKTIKELSILAGTAIIAAFAVNYFSPAGIALVGQRDIAKGVITANEKNDIDLNDLEIGDIALAKELYDSKKFLFVDARSRDDYDEGHIKGAVSLPGGQFDETNLPLRHQNTNRG